MATEQDHLADQQAKLLHGMTDNIRLMQTSIDQTNQAAQSLIDRVTQAVESTTDLAKLLEQQIALVAAQTDRLTQIAEALIKYYAMTTRQS